MNPTFPIYSTTSGTANVRQSPAASSASGLDVRAVHNAAPTSRPRIAIDSWAAMAANKGRSEDTPAQRINAKPVYDREKAKRLVKSYVAHKHEPSYEEKELLHLSLGAEKNSRMASEQDDNRQSLFYGAVSNNMTWLAKSLLQTHPSPSCKMPSSPAALNSPFPGDNDKKILPLYLAIENGCKSMITLLVKSGAGIDTQDSSGSTALHLAVEKGDKKLLTALLRDSAM